MQYSETTQHWSLFLLFFGFFSRPLGTVLRAPATIGITLFSHSTTSLVPSPSFGNFLSFPAPSHPLWYHLYGDIYQERCLFSWFWQWNKFKNWPVFDVKLRRTKSVQFFSTTLYVAAQLEKRSRGLHDELDVVQSVCPSATEWRALDTALDINNTAVRVYQPSRDLSDDDPDGDGQVATPGGTADADRRLQSSHRQWFYTVTCRNDVMAALRHCPGCCLAVDHDR